jgi:cyclophilin family peptidyl-prolyl cis-trans isomerase
MLLKSLFAAAGGLLLAGSVAAQEPAPAAPSPATIVPALEPENTLNLDLSTGGRVVVQLRPDIAPNHVERIKTLARQGFYNGVVFHRVIDGFMAQTGDPTGTGEGGSPLPDLAAEFNALPHVRGAVSAARTNEPNTANSQFFIMLAPRLTLDGKYSTFGRVVSGMQYVDAIQRGEPPANPTRVVRASIGADNVPPLPASALMAPPAPAPVPAPAAVEAAVAPVQATQPRQ